MASGSPRRIAEITFSFAVICACQALPQQHIVPEFSTLTVLNVSQISNNEYNAVEFETHGKNLYPGIQIKTSENPSGRNTLCMEDSKFYNVSEVFSNGTVARYIMRIPKNVCGRIYLCLPQEDVIFDKGGVPPNLFGKKVKTWYHQGPGIMFNLDTNVFCKADDSQRR